MDGQDGTPSADGKTLIQQVTDGILDEMERGVAPWVRPWIDGVDPRRPYNAHTGRRYASFNTLALWECARKRGYEHGGWLSLAQLTALGGKVRRGETPGHGLRWFRAYTKLPVETRPLGRDGDARHEARKDVATVTIYRRMPATRPFAVYNIGQIAGLPRRFYRIPPRALQEGIDRVDTFLAGVGARVSHGGDEAYYLPTDDSIHLPLVGQFRSSAHYYATSLHEHVHWSGHASRLDRTFGPPPSAAYAAEELMAEFGAAFLCATLGIPGKLRHAAYIKDWHRLLTDDPNALFFSAHTAETAVTFLQKLSDGASIEEARGPNKRAGRS